MNINFMQKKTWKIKSKYKVPRFLFTESLANSFIKDKAKKGLLKDCLSQILFCISGVQQVPYQHDRLMLCCHQPQQSCNSYYMTGHSSEINNIFRLGMLAGNWPHTHLHLEEVSFVVPAIAASSKILRLSMEEPTRVHYKRFTFCLYPWWVNFAHQ